MFSQLSFGGQLLQVTQHTSLSEGEGQPVRLLATT